VPFTERWMPPVTKPGVSPVAAMPYETPTPRCRQAKDDERQRTVTYASAATALASINRSSHSHSAISRTITASRRLTANRPTISAAFMPCCYFFMRRRLRRKGG
jgi:hypothetical protein